MRFWKCEFGIFEKCHFEMGLSKKRRCGGKTEVKRSFSITKAPITIQIYLRFLQVVVKSSGGNDYLYWVFWAEYSKAEVHNNLCPGKKSKNT